MGFSRKIVLTLVEAVMENAPKNGRSYAQEIFYEEIPASFSDQMESDASVKLGASTEPTNQTEVLDKLKDFSQKVADQTDSQHSDFLNENEISSLTQDQILKKLASVFPIKSIDQGLRINSSLNSSTRVLYLVDELRVEDKENDSELSSFLSLRASELFLKMNSAMKLKREEISFFSVGNQGESHRELILELIHFIKPEIVLTFGASTTSHFYSERKRLSEVHGNIEKIKLKLTSNEVYSFSLMPLFHPELLLVNGNMKKTAWLDMQKCMKLLGL